MDNKQKGSGYKKNIGVTGEKAAVDFLEKLDGWHILDVNYSCPIGEIDIVARDGDTIVFVEVRSTGFAGFELIGESINYRKQKKIKQLASYYMKNKKLFCRPCRFDVLLVQIDPKSMEPEEINWIKDAF